MKKIVIVLALISSFISVKAQDEERSDEKKGGFKKENLFTGGNVNLSGFSNSTLY